MAAAAERREEPVQWDTSEHGRLEGRGEQVRYTVRMIDDAKNLSRGLLVASEGTQANMGAVGVPTAVWADGACMHGPALDVGGGAEREGKPGGVAWGGPADADWAGAAGVGQRPDRGAVAAGQGAGGEQFRRGSGPASEANAAGRGEDLGGSQPVFSNRSTWL